MASNTAHPFLDPLWRRVALVVACAVWTAIEAYHQNTFWATMVGAVTAYGAWAYLYDYRPSTEDKTPESGA
ncbi:MAG: hypothetical protein KF874_11485 [Rhizobiaceae bacterium]|nr:hypothetical protein [Rhizobiaceae bacterium]